MKFMIASDIHGSAYYCRHLLDRHTAEAPERLILLGDILYHGPRNTIPKGYDTKEVIGMPNPLSDHILCIHGNCDSEVDQLVLDFRLIEDHTLLQICNYTVFLTHGHRYNRDTLPPELLPGDILLYGHSHVPIHDDCGGILCINPGSVSIPREDSPHSYMIWEDNVLSWKHLDGTVYDRIILPG